VLWNDAGVLELSALPKEVQYSTVNAVQVNDVNEDGVADLLVGGNDYKYKPQFGRQDASMGWICYGEEKDGNITFADCRPLGISGEIRAIKKLNENQIVLGINNGEIKVYEY
jgi:hypothetical protein